MSCFDNSFGRGCGCGRRGRGGLFGFGGGCGCGIRDRCGCDGGFDGFNNGDNFDGCNRGCGRIGGEFEERNNIEERFEIKCEQKFEKRGCRNSRGEICACR